VDSSEIGRTREGFFSGGFAREYILPRRLDLSTFARNSRADRPDRKEDRSRELMWLRISLHLAMHFMARAQLGGSRGNPLVWRDPFDLLAARGQVNRDCERLEGRR
jgi:hypothetical protein